MSAGRLPGEPGPDEPWARDPPASPAPRFPSSSEERPREPVDDVAIRCWRCGKALEGNPDICPHCRARVSSDGSHRGATGAPVGRPAIIKVLWIFFALLILSLVYGSVIHFGLQEQGPPDRQQVQDYLHAMLVVEIMDTLLVAGAALWIGRLAPFPARSATFRIMTWLYAVPILGIALGMNIGYGWFLHEFLSVPFRSDVILSAQGLTGTVWLAYAVQPAVVEEWFLRYLALGALRQYVSIHAAVVVSAVMFGMLHVFNPLGIPYLTIFGVILGYARVASGGMLLPVLMHFAHNAAVILIEVNA